MILGEVAAISLADLAIGFLPVVVVVAVHFYWSLDSWTTVYALSRMLAQLLLIGYLLAFIFESENAAVVVAVLTVMLFAASWIALRTISRTPVLFAHALLAIVVGGGTTLILVTQAVLRVDPWFSPNQVVPLAGMIFASAMNAVSLAAERYDSETNRGSSHPQARRIALRTCLIPNVNSLFAVGLVSLPGMMTGQILAGVEPHIAARYQIMVMCMLFGSAGISAICYLLLTTRGTSAAAP